MSLLAVALLSLSAMQLLAREFGNRGRHMTRAAAIAQTQMEQMQRDTWTNLAPTTPVLAHHRCGGGHHAQHRRARRLGRAGARQSPVCALLDPLQLRGPLVVARHGVRRAGFTLIELMVVMGIFGIFMIALGQLLISNERSYQATDQTADSPLW